MLESIGEAIPDEQFDVIGLDTIFRISLRFLA